MAIVSIETGPQWFVCESASGAAFKANDAVTFSPASGGAAQLEGRVGETRTPNFGNPPKPTRR